MKKKYAKQLKKLLCWSCILSLFISSTAMAAANIGDVYTIAGGTLSLRVSGDDSVTVCSYDVLKDSDKELNIEREYKLVGQDGNIHTDENGSQILFRVTEIEDKVFGQNQTFKYINIKANTGLKIGKSAFENVVVLGTLFRTYSVKIADGRLAELGEYAFAGSDIDGDFLIENMNGSIKSGAFQNMKLNGRLTITGDIDTLGDYAMSGMILNGLSMPETIRYMGDCVYKDTYLGSGNIIPLSNSLKSIGSRVFEGTNLAGIQLPEGDTVESAAADAFPDIEGMLIIIPEGLTNLEVFHFDQYQNLTFQTADGLSDDSPVIQYLKEKKLVYKKGRNGQLIYPKADEEPTPTPTQEATAAPTQKPEGTEKPTAAPTQKPEETEKPAATPTQKPEETEKPTEPPTQEPKETEKPTAAPTQEPEETEKPTAAPTQKPEETGTPTLAPSDRPSTPESPTPSGSSGEKTDSPGELKKNVVYTVGALKYRLQEKNKVAVTGPAKRNSTSISVPGTVTIEGKLYQVAGIGKRAFKGMKRLKKVKVGNYVKKIGDEAFAKCPKLKSIEFGTGLVSIGRKTLYQDKELRKIIFKGVKLKKIGKKTFSGIKPEKVRIRVKKSKLKFYQKLIKKAK